MILGDLIYHINWSRKLNHFGRKKSRIWPQVLREWWLPCRRVAMSSSKMVNTWRCEMDMSLHEEKSEWDRSRLHLTKMFHCSTNTSNNSPKIAWRGTSNDQLSQAEPWIEKRIEKRQNIQRIFTIHLSLGWSILVEIQILCRIYFVVLIRGSFPKAHCKACEETKDVHVHMLDILETVLSSALFSGCWVVEMIDSQFFCFREIYGNII